MPTSNGRAATAGLGDLLRLGARMSVSWLRKRGDFDPGAIGCHWARELAAPGGADSLTIAVAGKRLEVVTARRRSEDVLAGPPLQGGDTAGRTKRSAMDFLAPHALTIADGEDWTRLRAFNERVLGTGAPHPFAEAFLESVREAFSRPVATIADVRRAMGQAMVGIVLGNDPAEPGDPAEDVRILFDVVQSPLRRKALGFRYHPRRQRLYARLARAWDAAAAQERLTLVALARSLAPDLPRQQLLEQVPHWMFTFTGSGTDLLTRSLALITARPAVRERVRAEIAAAGPPARGDSVSRMPYLDACINETGRLFPPVTRTFHRPPAQAASSAADVVHFFLLLQRDDALGPTVHSFRPERWLSPALDEPAAASNLFLRGPRACPGKDLILFVCRAAISRQLELGVAAHGSRLARDPLPITFPGREARFTASEARP